MALGAQIIDLFGLNFLNDTYQVGGICEVTVMEDKTYILETGDSIILDSKKPHKLTNIYDGQTIAVWVDSPASW